MYKVPSWGWAPGPRHCSQTLPPCPLVPSIWSAKQISIRINQPTAPTLWSRGCLQPRPEAETSPPYYCSLEDEAPATGTQGLMGDGEADKTNTRKLSQLSLACLLSTLTSHSHPSRQCQVAGRGLGPPLGREQSGHQQVPASLLLSLISRLRGGGGGGREANSVG